MRSGWARAVENDVNNLRLQLHATDRAEAWGFASWPQLSVTTPSLFVNKRESITVDAELLDENGRILGSQTFSFNWNLTVSFSDIGLSLSINDNYLLSISVLFENINIYDITDTLQIRIARNTRDKTIAAFERLCSVFRLPYPLRLGKISLQIKNLFVSSHWQK